MESNGFDDQIFQDFPGQSLAALQTANGGAMLGGKNHHSDRNPGSMHSIQVMLGMQQHHQDMMLGVSPMSGSPPHGKMSDSQCHGSLQNSMQGHDLNVIFHNPNLDSPNGNISVKRKADEGIMLQPVVVSGGEGIPMATTKKSESKKKGDNNGVKKKKTRYLR